MSYYYWLESEIEFPTDEKKIEALNILRSWLEFNDEGLEETLIDSGCKIKKGSISHFFESKDKKIEREILDLFTNLDLSQLKKDERGKQAKCLAENLQEIGFNGYISGYSDDGCLEGYIYLDSESGEINLIDFAHTIEPKLSKKKIKALRSYIEEDDPDSIDGEDIKDTVIDAWEILSPLEKLEKTKQFKT